MVLFVVGVNDGVNDGVSAGWAAWCVARLNYRREVSVCCWGDYFFMRFIFRVHDGRVPI